MKVAFQSEDIINAQSKMGPRRKSNPNLILGRTDINKQQDSENDFTNQSHTLPRSFGRRNNNKKQQIMQSQTVRKEFITSLFIYKKKEGRVLNLFYHFHYDS